MNIHSPLYSRKACLYDHCVFNISKLCREAIPLNHWDPPHQPQFSKLCSNHIDRLGRVYRWVPGFLLHVLKGTLPAALHQHYKKSSHNVNVLHFLFCLLEHRVGVGEWQESRQFRWVKFWLGKDYLSTKKKVILPILLYSFNSYSFSSTLTSSGIYLSMNFGKQKKKNHTKDMFYY